MSVDQSGEKLQQFLEKISVHEHGLCPHLFNLICSSNALWYSVHKSCTFCINFIPMDMILFDTILSRIVFLNLLSNWYPLVYGIQLIFGINCITCDLVKPIYSF